MLANLHLLFWLSLIPFTTGWLGENRATTLPTLFYGVNLLLAALAYKLLQMSILAAHGRDSLLGRAVGRDIKGNVSLALYAAAIGCAFVSPLLAQGLYAFVALIWLVPDGRIEKALQPSTRL